MVGYVLGKGNVVYMKLIGLAIILLLPVVGAAQPSNRSLLNSMHKSLNVLCRGGSGDEPSTDAACDARTQVSDLLRTIGKGKTSANGAKALSIYKSLNEMCRGYSGDLPETQKACDVRNQASSLLRNLGYCWKGAWWKKC